jgi:hypothetical protein
MFAVLTSFGQNETTKWYFGSTAAVDFLSGAPVALTSSVMATSEGSASIAGPGGNLLFYTNGNTIWNANHIAMSNGSGLFGSSISCQSAVIVKQPGSASLYYVFTMRNWTDGGNGAHFSIVDMTLASGLGDVTTKNQLIYGNTRESLTAVCHANGTDFWIVLHDMFTNEFRSYLLTASGLSAMPVISAVGAVFTGANRYGALKSSQDGTRLGYALGGSAGITTELYNFSNATGIVSNAITLNNGVFFNAYGIEFSPNNQVLYVCEYNGTAIQQFNLAAGTPALILASNINIATGANTKANLQLAPDGKIYACLAYQSFLAVINNPNTLGVGCGFVNNNVSLAGRTCGLGLPNFMPCLVPVILPLRWTYFLALQGSEAVILDWGMSDMQQVGGFSIQRRNAVSEAFEEIGNVLVTRSSSPAFEWIDQLPQPGWNEYRIAAISESGETQYSEVVRTQSGIRPLELRVFPNPISKMDCWNVEVLNGDGIVAIVYDEVGRSAASLTSQQFTACAADLPPGVYFMQAKSKSGVLAMQKLLKL